MRLLTFKGGYILHITKVYKQSGSSKGRGSKKIVYIPLQQHIGAPAKPIVKKGDEVKRSNDRASRWLRFSKCSLISFW